MPALIEGIKAPDFKLPATGGKILSLNDFKDKNLVVYFYPKDDTPGCTTEACGFRDSHQKITSTNTVILGVSPDNLKSHDKFVSKFNLPFILLSDEDKTMAKDYGIWVEKSMYGKKYMGVARTTFIIDSLGIIRKIFSKVDPKIHDQEVLGFLKSLI